MDSNDNKLSKLFESSLQNVVKSFDSLFQESAGQLGHLLNQQSFYVDVYETEDEVIVEAEVPGFRKEHIEIRLIGDHLKISAEYNQTVEDVSEEYVSMRSSSIKKTERLVALPCSVQEEKARALYQEGILKVILQKGEQKQRKIEIE